MLACRYWPPHVGQGMSAAGAGGLANATAFFKGAWPWLERWSVGRGSLFTVDEGSICQFVAVCVERAWIVAHEESPKTQRFLREYSTAVHLEFIYC